VVIVTSDAAGQGLSAQTYLVRRDLTVVSEKD